jgi:hypothetical protein
VDRQRSCREAGVSADQSRVRAIDGFGYYSQE